MNITDKDRINWLDRTKTIIRYSRSAYTTDYYQWHEEQSDERFDSIRAAIDYEITNADICPLCDKKKRKQ